MNHIFSSGFVSICPWYATHIPIYDIDTHLACDACDRNRPCLSIKHHTHLSTPSSSSSSSSLVVVFVVVVVVFSMQKSLILLAPVCWSSGFICFTIRPYVSRHRLFFACYSLGFSTNDRRLLFSFSIHPDRSLFAYDFAFTLAHCRTHEYDHVDSSAVNRVAISQRFICSTNANSFSVFHAHFDNIFFVVL